MFSKKKTAAEKSNTEKVENLAKEKKPGKLAGFLDGILGSKKKKATQKTEQVAGTETDTATHSQDELRLLKEAEKVYNEGLASIRDLISPSSMKFEYDHFRLDNLYAASYVVFAYPRYLETNWLSPVINFDVTMDISMFIYPTDSQTILKSLRNKVAQMQASISINAEKGRVRDPALEVAMRDAEEMRDKLQQGTEKFFQYALYFTVYSKNKGQLEKFGKQLESLLGGKMVMTKHAHARSEQAFNASAPYATDELYVVRNMNTEPLSTTFPFTSSSLSSDKGILYGLNRHNNSLVIFDRFDLPNANEVVLATSGAGKSYAVKLEILRSMMLDADVIVIDPENEYKALCEMVSGSYLKVSLNSEYRINPFDLPQALEGEEEQPGDLLRSNVIALIGLMKVMLGTMTHEEEALINKAIMDTYKLKGITMETENPGEIQSPTMEDLEDVLKNTKGCDSLANRISQYTTGIFGGIFNKPSNISLDNKMVVFSIRDLDDGLRPAATYVILNFIWNRVRSSLKRRIMVIDEAWSLMQHEDSARFLHGLVKRARKYYLGVTTITQDVDDFMKSDLGKPIINNSAMRLLLKQADSAIVGLKEVFNLTEQEEYYLLNAQQGDGIFFAGDKHVAIQVISSYNEHKVVTSNPEELLKMKKEAEGFDAR
ncbi:MAG: DUF87 domain-containing protein [Candidatus Gracilibacteria bacterium]|nr:DUF87 domain-containing protein [Candidatus Gracilibacteria bacterium]